MLEFKNCPYTKVYLRVRRMQRFWFFLICLVIIQGSSLYSQTPPQELSDRHSNSIKLCIAMRVKNDEAVIQRCLDSVKNIADCISICAVDSTDQTTEIIKKFLRSSGVPGKVWDHKVCNRTQSVQAAQMTVKEVGFSPSQTYLLVMDAGMVLRSLSFRKSDLRADSYSLLEQASTYSKYDTHLLRASLNWTHRNALWGSWVCQEPFKEEKLATLTIEACEDGESSIPVLEKGFKKDPSSAFYSLRLAQLHRNQKQFLKAIDCYKTYIERGQDKEALWFSKYMLGKCLEEIGERDAAAKRYHEAYDFNPSRAEPLLKLASHYRKEGRYETAYSFAKKGSLLPRPKDQMLFDTPPLKSYQFKEELAISAYYTNFREEGYAAASALLIQRDIPWPVKDQTYKNILFYVRSLKSSRIVPISLELPLIREGGEERYKPMNPSIQRTQEGYRVICRAVNYTQKGAIPSNFKTLDAEGIFRSRNYLVHYDRHFKRLSQHEIVEKLPRERLYNLVVGLEDCRLFEFNNSWWFTCTTSDTSVTQQRQISLCRLEDRMGKSEIAVDKLTPLQGPDPHRCEKNWLPFVKDGNLYVVYSYDPLIIYQPHLETGACERVIHEVPDYDLSGFRGSAAPIAYKNGYLILVHETVHFPDLSRNYLHRFVYLDKNFKIEQISKPFIFSHLGIEFCCSMTLDHAGKELVMAVGIEDAQAFLYFVKLETVEKQLLN